MNKGMFCLKLEFLAIRYSVNAHFLVFLRNFTFILLDGMFVCVRDESNVGLIHNSLTSIPLPKLQRSYVSYHQICGKNTPSDGSTAIDCSVKAYMYTALDPTENEFETKLFHEIPSTMLRNDGSLSQSQEWFYDEIKIPRTNGEQQLRFLASFDSKFGGFGIDNVHFHTPQM